VRIISDDQLVVQRHIEISTDEHTLTLELRLTKIAHTLLPSHTNQGTITPPLLLPCPPIHVESRTLENKEKIEDWVLTVTTHLDDGMDGWMGLVMKKTS